MAKKKLSFKFNAMFTETKHLNIQEIAGTAIVSREHGNKIRTIIESSLREGHDIIVDFSNLTIASPSFIDEAIAKLLLKYPSNEIKSRLSLINMSGFDKALLNDLVRARIRERDILEKMQGEKSAKFSRLDEAERAMIVKALIEARGNKYRAAKILGIPRSSLYSKLKKLEIGLH